MKTLSRLLALTSVSLFTALIPASHAAPPSPAGDWDFVMTGKQRGVALISFDPGFILSGAEILRPAPPANSSSSSVDPRNPAGTPASRTPSVTSTNSSTSVSNFYGGATLEGGVWTYDSSGRLIGAFNEVYQTVESRTMLQTNMVDGSNIVTTVTEKFYVSHTNGISFRGAVSGNRLTINAYTPRGLATFKGVRVGTLPDYSGNYYTVATKDRPFVEFFTTSPNGLASIGYNVENGTGAGYIFNGSMLVSKQKQVALLSLTDSGALTVCTGAYKTNRFTGANRITGTLQGTDGTRRNFPCTISPRP